jgi:formylglycine-generating enzyme required for sulfatase activity
MNLSPENHLISLTAAAQAANDPDMRRDLAEQLCQAIEQAGLDTTPATRARAGDCLAALGDPRFNPQRWYLPRDDMLGFIHIPAGKFWMGQECGEDDEKPQHEVHLPDFWIGRYPVTVAQFRAFVLASGYTAHNPRALEGKDNHPAVYITWYDALAYCDWLEGCLLRLNPDKIAESAPGSPQRAFWQGLEDSKLHVRLPSEAEWEKCARGPSNGPEPTRLYPWGNDFDPNRANLKPSGLGATSAVGCFPGGASPYGLQDLGGNVWEWTRSLCKYPYPYDPKDKRRENIAAARTRARIKRGGGYSDVDANKPQCSYRGGGLVYYGFEFSGFRVAVR